MRPKRLGGQRLFGHAAPRLSSAKCDRDRSREPTSAAADARIGQRELERVRRRAERTGERADSCR